jgi:hypothetical protein
VLSTAHLLIGGALGSLLRRTPAALAAGVISHHLADCVIHTDTGTFRTENDDEPSYSAAETAVAVFDLAVGFTLLYLAARRRAEWQPILAGAIGGITPDLIDNAPVVAPRFRATPFGSRYHAMHHRLHRTAKPNEWLLGTVTQLAVVVVGAALLRR